MTGKIQGKYKTRLRCLHSILFYCVQEEIDEKTRRERLEAKAKAWAAEKLGKSWQKLFPIVIGPIWQGEDKEPELIEKLMTYRVCLFIFFLFRLKKI